MKLPVFRRRLLAIVTSLSFATALTLSTNAVAQQPSSAESYSPLPLSTSASGLEYQNENYAKAFRQSLARYRAAERAYRAEFYNNIGYSPLRPATNASYMSNVSAPVYIPARAVIVNPRTGASYW